MNLIVTMKFPIRDCPADYCPSPLILRKRVYPAVGRLKAAMMSMVVNIVCRIKRNRATHAYKRKYWNTPLPLNFKQA